MKWIGLIIGGIIIVGGAWLLFTQGSSDMSATTTEEGEVMEGRDEGTSSEGSNNEAPTMEDGTIDGEVDVSVNESATVVTYTGDGFSPSVVTVAQGETVRFTNEADSGVWVASDVHPTHANYGGTTLSEHCNNADASFDSCEQIAPGASWEFTFDTVGEWGYHNHTRASQVGVVRVTE